LNYDDLDGDSVSTCDGDCDDTDPSIYPPYDDLHITEDTTFKCTGTYEVYDEGEYGIVIIDAPGITVDFSGLTLKIDSAMRTGSVVDCTRYDNVLIKNLNVEGYAIGVDAQRRYNVDVMNSSFTNCACGIEAAAHSTITNNSFYGCQIGVGYQGAKNTITNNHFEGNNYSIAVWGSNDDVITDNSFVNTLYGGLLFRGMTNSTVSDNLIQGTGYSYAGIRLENYTTDNEITNNTISGYSYGLYFYNNSNNNTLTYNSISNSRSYGTYFYYNCSGNILYNNNFINNATQAYLWGCGANIFNLDAPTGGNYWSNWTTPDINGDGFVDDPYVFTGGQDELPLTEPFSLNEPPVANAGPDQTVEQESYAGAEVTLDGSGSTDPDSTEGTNDDIVSFEWYEGGTPLGSGEIMNRTFGLSSHTVTLVVTDSAGEVDDDEVVITVLDTTPPVITLNGAASMTLECMIDSYTEPGATATDICDPDVPVIIGGDTVDTSTCGTYIVTYDATDASGNVATQVIRTVIVQDTTPPVITIDAPQPYGLYRVRDLTLDFSAYDLVSGNIEPPDLWGTLDDAAGYSVRVEPGTVVVAAGVYTLVVSAVDGAGNTTSTESEPVLFVVYDPEGGFVTGGGWIDSPERAYKPDTSLTGKANFGFVSKYKKGATVPTGNTEFVFKAGDLNFHSRRYDWLVVNQAGTNAQFKGSGTINGEMAPNGEYYRFMLWARDDDPDYGDTFRIRIWQEDDLGNETDIYDNGFDQPIGGGSIVVHTK
jgi:parallel beta-helix repeat protein